MKIFVGYGYNSRDLWIESLVFRLIDAFGDSVESGKEIFGQNLDEGVKAKIAECDALIGFTTRREQIGTSDAWTTHQWVRDELLTAANAARPIPFVEVRETQVQEPGGMLAGRARINYNEANRALCLVEIAEAIGRWHQQPASFDIELMPEDFTREVRPLLLRPGALRCVYHVIPPKGVDEGPELPTNILRRPGRLAIRTGAVPRDASITVKVWSATNQLLWSSDLQPVESRVLHLTKTDPTDQ